MLTECDLHRIRRDARTELGRRARRARIFRRTAQELTADPQPGWSASAFMRASRDLLLVAMRARWH